MSEPRLFIWLAGQAGTSEAVFALGGARDSGGPVVVRATLDAAKLIAYWAREVRAEVNVHRGPSDPFGPVNATNDQLVKHLVYLLAHERIHDGTPLPPLEGGQS
jgi:hypothetical protein